MKKTLEDEIEKIILHFVAVHKVFNKEDMFKKVVQHCNKTTCIKQIIRTCAKHFLGEIEKLPQYARPGDSTNVDNEIRWLDIKRLLGDK